jgi:ATP-dependent Clp protease ATP-binding subunit ClpA
VAAEILHERGLRLNAIREELARSVVDRQTLIKPKETPLLSEFSRDLTQAAMDGVLDPLVGRDGEIDRVIQILCRRTKNNPVLIGDPGVGKTAIVEGLAQRIVDGEVPSFLADKRILVLDLSLIVAGTKYRGQFEERLKTIMKELVDNPNTVVFIDEAHTLVARFRGAHSMPQTFTNLRSRVARSMHRATTPAGIPEVDRKIVALNGASGGQVGARVRMKPCGFAGVEVALRKFW